VTLPISILSDQQKVLPDLLGEVIKEQEGQAVFDSVELLRKGFIAQRQVPDGKTQADLLAAIEALDVDNLDRVIHAFSTFFHLTNISEEQTAQHRRASAEEAGTPWANSFIETLECFKDNGKTLEETLKLIQKLHYSPTFTAHPTEAKRPIVLEALQRIHHEYQALISGSLSQTEQTKIKHRLKAMIQIFWKTEAVRPQKPTVYDEIENSLYYFRESIFNCLPEIYRDLEDAIKQVYPEARGHAIEIPNIVRFGTWVGGDRDGNPFVTPAQVELPDAFLASSEKDNVRLNKYLGNEHLKEPFRRKLSLSKLRLEATRSQAQARMDDGHVSFDPLAYRDEAHFRTDLELIRDALIHNNEANLTRGSLQDLLRLLDSCGNFMYRFLTQPSDT